MGIQFFLQQENGKRCGISRITNWSGWERTTDTDSARKWMEAFLSCPVREASAGARQLLFSQCSLSGCHRPAFSSADSVVYSFYHQANWSVGREDGTVYLGGEAEIGPAESGRMRSAQIDRHSTSRAARLQEMIRQKYVLSWKDKSPLGFT